jgi:hypothetical protein
MRKLLPQTAWRTVAVLATLTLLSVFVFGQAESGSISGTVRDTTGAVVPGASVTVKSIATSVVRTTTTSDVGHYTVPGLTPGAYEVAVSKPGFAAYKAQIEVTVGGRATLDAQLEVGKESTVIEVTAGAAAQVNTETQEVSQLITTQQLGQLPSLTRNPYDFVAISGNVSAGDSTTPNVDGSQNQTGRGVGFSFNGQRMSGTEILLDGVENVGLFSATIGQLIPVDSVQEYSVITNNFSPEYGRASGGVVNVTTKTGTNAWHGSAWEFNRLSAYTANTFANDAANAAFLESGGTGALPEPKGEYTRNQFGFEVGGPIVKNKLFVYGNTEWLRVRSQPTETEEVLDPSFISLLPANVQAYMNAYGTNVAPPSGKVTTMGQLGLTALQLNGITPISPNQPVFDITNFKTNFDAGGDLPQNSYRIVGRLDYNLGDKTQMFFRYARDDEDQFAGTAVYGYTPYAQYQVGTVIANDAGLYSFSHTFNPYLLSSTKVSFNRLNTKNSYNQALTFTPNLMITGGATDPITGYLIQMPGLLNYASGVGGLPYGGPQNTLQLEQDLSWTKGKHSMRFGGQFTYIQLNIAYGAYNQAVELLGSTLPQGLANLVNAGGATDPTGALASPLLSFSARVDPQGKLPCVANPDGSLIQTPECTITPPLPAPADSRSYRYKDWAIYAADSFRITPRLIVNYGLRYEHYGVQHNVNPALDSNFYWGPGSSVEERVRNGGVQIADKSSVGGFWAPNWGTVGPRLGFAYDVFGDGKTSLRGGFGISYERNFGNVTYNASFNPPASAVINSTCIPTGSVAGLPIISSCPFLVTNNNGGPLSLPTTPPQGLPQVELRMPNPSINTASTQFWSLDLQRQLARNTVLDVGYAAAHGVHLYDIENINQIGGGQAYLGDPTTFPAFPDCNYTPGPGVVPPCLTRPNQQYAAINMRGSLGTSSYNALNVKFQTQNLHNSGLSLVANYTWAHSLDDLSSTFSDSLQGGSGVIGSLGYTDPFNPKLDWGSSDFDIPHRFVVSPIWEVPWLKNGKGLLNQAAGGWNLSGIFTVRGGTPFSVYDYSDNAFGYTVPRMVPAAPFTTYRAGSPTRLAPNLFGILPVPEPAAVQPSNQELQISDLGPFPADMMKRNSLRGPGAWSFDMAVQKNFKITERVNLQFRAEGFDLLNHHNLYAYTGNLYYTTETPESVMGNGYNTVTALKGGLGSLASGGNHDERRFGQFGLRVTF